MIIGSSHKTCLKWTTTTKYVNNLVAWVCEISVLLCKVPYIYLCPPSPPKTPTFVVRLSMLYYPWVFIYAYWIAWAWSCIRPQRHHNIHGEKQIHQTEELKDMHTTIAVPNENIGRGDTNNSHHQIELTHVILKIFIIIVFLTSDQLL